VAVSEEKAEEQHNCPLLGAIWDMFDLDNPSKSTIPSGSSEHEPPTLKASHPCQLCKINR